MKTKLTCFLICIFSTIISAQNTSVIPLDSSLSHFISCRDFTLSNTQDEAYFTVQNLSENAAILVKASKRNGSWSDFDILTFSGEFRDIEPFLSPDNLRLYFSSNRPKNTGTSEASDYDIWYVERQTLTSDWSVPINLGPPVNTTANEFYPSISRSKTIYYTSDEFTASKKDELLFANWNGKTYSKPTPLSDSINSNKHEFNAYIAPNESFIIFSVYKGEQGLGSGDLYISFKDDSGHFKKRRNMGSLINSARMDYCPFYDVYSKTLYFTSKREPVQKKKVSSVTDFQKQFNSYMNGLSRIYKCTIELDDYR